MIRIIIIFCIDQKALGVTMKVQRSSLQDVKAVLSKRKRTEYSFDFYFNYNSNHQSREIIFKRLLKILCQIILIKIIIEMMNEN